MYQMYAYLKVYDATDGKYDGFTAQIIQHEIDHFEGILI